jgi:hypothetical protein
MTGLHLQKITEKTFCKIKEIDADGKESYVIKESPELLKELEKDPTLDLAYSDAFTE